MDFQNKEEERKMANRQSQIYFTVVNQKGLFSTKFTHTHPHTRKHKEMFLKLNYSQEKDTKNSAAGTISCKEDYRYWHGAWVSIVFHVLTKWNKKNNETNTMGLNYKHNWKSVVNFSLFFVLVLRRDWYLPVITRSVQSLLHL